MAQIKIKWVALAAAIVVLLAGVIIMSPVGGSDNASAAKTRTYYIAADEVFWDYAPTFVPEDPEGSTDPMTGEPYGEDMLVFLEQGADRIGDTYIKSQFREYTDGTFTTLKSIPSEWEHLGILGPVIRAEVGDTIVIHFKNNTDFPSGMHPHGVFYNKTSEGTDYNDGTSGGDGAVPSGGTWTYTWEVPVRAGPAPNDPSSIVWGYHSHNNEPADTNAGLIGPILITAKGKANQDGTPKDVDREFVTLFTVFDENASVWLDENIEEYAGSPETVDPDDEGFAESNLMHSVNGYVEGNLPGLTMKVGEKVRWYVLALGTEVDLHTAHWHANTVLDNGNRSDVIFLGPMSTKTVDMVPDNPGVWMFHCHVNDHISAGMMEFYTVNQ